MSHWRWGREEVETVAGGQLERWGGGWGLDLEERRESKGLKMVHLCPWPAWLACYFLFLNVEFI